MPQGKSSSKKLKRNRRKRNGVGDTVRKLRADRDWSQSDVARQCQLNGWDVGRDIIAKIEGFDREVTDLELRYLAKAFAVPVADLLPEKLSRKE